MLALNVGAMLISFSRWSRCSTLLGVRRTRAILRRLLSLELIFGWVFAPIAWSMGVPGAMRRRSATCWAHAWR